MLDKSIEFFKIILKREKGRELKDETLQDVYKRQVYRKLRKLLQVILVKPLGLLNMKSLIVIVPMPMKKL